MSSWWERLMGTKSKQQAASNDQDADAAERAEAKRRIEALNVRVAALSGRTRQEKQT